MWLPFLPFCKHKTLKMSSWDVGWCLHSSKSTVTSTSKKKTGEKLKWNSEAYLQGLEMTSLEAFCTDPYFYYSSESADRTITWQNPTAIQPLYTRKNCTPQLHAVLRAHSIRMPAQTCLQKTPHTPITRLLFWHYKRFWKMPVDWPWQCRVL